ncbi:MAG TPA: NADH-quinone oxidoreductase subunit M [Acidobacteriaceae bacterium]|nr:NADH-quinone oxidoreductase subunit M [Acidobacteriaceae bacterium]
MNGFPWLSVLTATPFAGAILVLLTGKNRNAARIVTAAASGASLAIVLGLWHGFNAASGALQFQERRPWIPALGVDYHVAIDGLGLLMLLLSAMVVLMSVAASWSNQEHERLYFALVLLLETGLFGTFTALNFIHWFFYWELGLIPAFFLIRLWGGPQRARAATQFFVYTMVGSVGLLLAFLAIFLATGKFDFIDLAQMAQSGQLGPALAQGLHWGPWTGGRIAEWVFWAAFLGFAVKVPIVPFHTWLPSAYAEAPSSTTMLLTGAMSKMGLYGLLRILLPIFPEQMQHALPLLLWLAVASVVWSAFVAWAQTDLKRIFAYSSVNHLGYCVLGVLVAVKWTGGALAGEKAAALDGALLQTFNHALTAAALFWFVAMLERRSGGLRGLNDFGGLRKVAPVFCGLMGIAVFSSLGLPGLNGFPGEFLIFKGAFSLATWATALSVIGLLITAVFLLVILERVFYGPVSERWAGLRDLSTGERLALAPAVALMFVLGFYPQLIVGVVNSTVIQLVSQLGPHVGF